MRGYSEEALLLIYSYCKAGNQYESRKYKYRVFQTGDNVFELHRLPVSECNRKYIGSECILRVIER